MNFRKIAIGNLCLLAMLATTQPALNAAKHHKHSSSSSSSESDRKSCKKSSKKSCCDKVHVISCVPVVIDKPGKWCVGKDLVYTGSGAAITVAANNVTLNFHNHSLTLTNRSAVGVYACGVQELTVENDIIQSSAISTSPSSKAFHIVNCEKVKLDNIFTANTFFGVHAVSSRDVLVTHSRFKDHIGGGGTIDLTSGGIRADTCSAVVIEESTFSGAGKGAGADNRSVQTIFRDGSTACRISNCEYTDIEGAVLAYGVDGLVIENCITQTAPRTFNINDPASIAIFRPAIQLASQVTGEGILTSNVTVRNCLINGNYDGTNINNCDPEAPECILKGSLGYAISIDNAENILVEGCEVSNFCILTRDFSWIAGALIDIYAAEGQVRPNHITIRDCTLRGNAPEFFTAAHGIQTRRADNVIIEGCNVIGTFYGIIPIDSTNVVIRDSTVDGTGHCSIICFGMDGLTIANNHVMNAGFNSMQLIDEEDGLKNVLVEGNTISNGYANGIYLGFAENAVVRNNTIDHVGLHGIIVIYAVNTTVQDNISNYNGYNDEEPVRDGIAVGVSSKTNLIGNTCSGNTEAGIWIGAGATDTFVQDNTTTQNGIWGIIDADAAGEVTAFFNKSCDNGVANCVDIPYMQAPGNTYFLGANLCCCDREDAAASTQATAKTKEKSVLGETEKAPDSSLRSGTAL